MGERTELKAERLRELRAVIDEIRELRITAGDADILTSLIDAELQRRSDSAGKCETCKGSGQEWPAATSAGGNYFDRPSKCSSCKGTGKASRSDSAEGGGAWRSIAGGLPVLRGHYLFACGDETKVLWFQRGDDQDELLRAHRATHWQPLPPPPGAIAFIERGGEKVEHSDDAAVDRFAAAMKAKLKKKRDEDNRGGWDNPRKCSVEYLAELLVGHVIKGDPLDVGNFAMMLWNRGCEVELLRAAKAALSAPPPLTDAITAPPPGHSMLVTHTKGGQLKITRYEMEMLAYPGETIRKDEPTGHFMFDPTPPLTDSQREAASHRVTTVIDILQEHIRERRMVRNEVAVQLKGQLERVLDQLANGTEPQP